MTKTEYMRAVFLGIVLGAAMVNLVFLINFLLDVKSSETKKSQKLQDNSDMIGKIVTSIPKDLP
jgi:mannose/fructose/N-acetylgalactosamine-specific phosphotransferase system component IID